MAIKINTHLFLTPRSSWSLFWEKHLFIYQFVLFKPVEYVRNWWRVDSLSGYSVLFSFDTKHWLRLLQANVSIIQSDWMCGRGLGMGGWVLCKYMSPCYIKRHSASHFLAWLIKCPVYNEEGILRNETCKMF